MSNKWGKLTSKLNSAKDATITKAKDIADSTVDTVSIAASNTGDYLKKTPENLKDFANETISTATQLASKENIEIYKAKLSKASEDTWSYVRESPEKAVEKFKHMDKSHKVLALSAMVGGAVVSVPFIIALGPVSIVSALATLGMGSLAAGGFGVAGGLIVTGGGAVLAASLAGTVANKLIDDPEINELIDNYGKLEEIIKQNFQTMDNNQEKYLGLYEKYAKAAEFVIELQSTIDNGEKYDLEQVVDRNNRVKYIIEDLSEALTEETDNAE